MTKSHIHSCISSTAYKPRTATYNATLIAASSPITSLFGHSFSSSISSSDSLLQTRKTIMTCLKNLIAMALTKWRKLAGIGRGSISLPRIGNKLAKKGHFVMYTTDRKRFVVPLPYLRCSIFRELLRMSEEVFGLPGDGPITLPCSATFMEYVLSNVQRTLSDKDSRQGIAYVFGM